jgi:hypothetical protein
MLQHRQAHNQEPLHGSRPTGTAVESARTLTVGAACCLQRQCGSCMDCVCTAQKSPNFNSRSNSRNPQDLHTVCSSVPTSRPDDLESCAGSSTQSGTGPLAARQAQTRLHTRLQPARSSADPTVSYEPVTQTLAEPAPKPGPQAAQATTICLQQAILHCFCLQVEGPVCQPQPAAL